MSRGPCAGCRLVCRAVLFLIFGFSIRSCLSQAGPFCLSPSGTSGSSDSWSASDFSGLRFLNFWFLGFWFLGGFTRFSFPGFRLCAAPAGRGLLPVSPGFGMVFRSSYICRFTLVAGLHVCRLLFVGASLPTSAANGFL